ncbi:hypothetical protein Nmel_007184 [Mimus melanotis]
MQDAASSIKFASSSGAQTSFLGCELHLTSPAWADACDPEGAASSSSRTHGQAPERQEVLPVPAVSPRRIKDLHEVPDNQNFNLTKSQKL